MAGLLLAEWLCLSAQHSISGVGHTFLSSLGCQVGCPAQNKREPNKWNDYANEGTNELIADGVMYPLGIGFPQDRKCPPALAAPAPLPWTSHVGMFLHKDNSVSFLGISSPKTAQACTMVPNVAHR